jgi:hypothetical protein
LDSYVFPANSEKDLIVNLSLNIAASPTNLNYTIRVIGSRMTGGKIAFLCRDDNCNSGIENDLIDWLTVNGWYVTPKAYDKWTIAELDEQDLIVCSDETYACNIKPDSAVYNEHELRNKGIIEIPSSRMINAAYNFGYTTYPEGFDAPIFDNLYVTRWDPITNGFSGITEIFNKQGRMTVITDSRLKPNVIDLSDVFRNLQKSTLFKMDEYGNQGRYAYVGWFYKSIFGFLDLAPNDLNSNGDLILKKTLNWVQCGKVDGCGVYGDLTPPVAYNGTPTGIIAFDTPPLYVNSDEEALCKGSIDIDKSFDEMDMIFLTTGTQHKYRVTTPLSQGSHTVYVRCKDVNDNIATESYSWSFIVKIPSSREIAYICRSDDCNYNIEDELISWLRSEGWSVDGKAYNKWTETELKNYDLIFCSDELIACKVNPGTIVYRLHKEENKPFVEVGDYRYLSAGWRFGYVDNPYGAVGREQLHLNPDPITQSFPITTEAFSGSIGMVTVADYNLASSVIDLADSGNHDRSTMFKVNQDGNQGRFVYVGWFYESKFSDLTPAGETILRRAINWAHCERIDGCK